jgi:hypothetical protein
MSGTQSRPARRIRMTFPDTGASALADLLDDDAPAVCDAVWNALPVEAKALHGMYSGAEVFLMTEPLSPPGENLTQLPLPGELLYFQEAGTGVIGARQAVGEICFVYGRGVVLRQHEGVATYGSLFARIPGDWKTDWVEFQQACRAVRREGPRTLRIDRV